MRFTGLLIVMIVLSSCSNKQAPAPYIHYGTNGGANSAGVHTVKPGDSVWNISQRYKLSMHDIIHVNEISPPYVLHVDQRLALPPPRSYSIKEKDTLYGISRTFDISLTQLVRLNGLQKPYKIYPGQELKLPAINEKPRLYNAKSKKVRSKRSTTYAIQKNVPKRTYGLFSWPVKGAIISTFGPKKDGLHNDGINIKARKGSKVAAAENGIVAYAGNQLEGFGNLILIRHSDGWMSAYAHLDKITVKKGQKVKLGELLGYIGSTGSVSSPQLHFEIRRGTKAVDPLKYLKGINT
jgi:murein DD-endopeptidase MepM/ murein hydrolase activator NlpD